MNRPMEYPFFPIVDSFNASEIVVSDLEQVLPFFPSEIKIDTLDNEMIFTVTSPLHILKEPYRESRFIFFSFDAGDHCFIRNSQKSWNE